jgi:hypothetical protein
VSYRANNWAKLQKAGGPGRKGLLLLITDMCDEDNTCFPSIALLAQIMETSERYIRGMLQDLEDLKLISSEFRYRNGRHTSSLYRVLVPEGFTEVSVSAYYRNHGSATTGTMVPGLPEPWMRAEPPVEPPSEPPEASAVAEAGADAVASSSANAVAFAAARKQSAKIPKQGQAAAAARDDPRKEHVTYYNTSGDVETTNKQIWAAIDELSAAGVATLMAEFKRYRPKIARDCRADAEGQLGEAEADEVRLLRLTLKYGVQYYGGHWPKFVLPPSMRSATKPAARAA